MRSRQLLAEQRGQITPRWMMRIARDHYEDTFLGGPYFEATDPDFQSICMHASPANFTWGNTASSCVAILPQSSQAFPVFWWTPGPPCNGCYVPFFVHGTIEKGPFSLNFHVGLVETPASTYRTLTAAAPFLNLRSILDHPAVKCGMIHANSSLALPLPFNTADPSTWHETIQWVSYPLGHQKLTARY